MNTKVKSLKIQQLVAAPASEAYEAFTSASALCEWLCNVAQADARPGGRIYLWWRGGYYASGEYISLKPAEKIEFSWHGRNEPGITHVKVTFKEKLEHTLVNVLHMDIGVSKDWNEAIKAYRKGWKSSLENLKSVLETGQDLRYLRQPVIGLSNVQEIHAENAAKYGLKLKEGLYVESVVEGMGAYEAGLQEGDVIVKIAGKKVSRLSSLASALRGYQAGDKIKVTYYRNGEKRQAKVELSSRKLPDIPASLEELILSAQQLHLELNAEMQKTVEGIPDQEASFCPQGKEWSVKEILAHLIVVEREFQSWIVGLVEGQEADAAYHSNLPTRLKATVTAFGDLRNLVEELKRAELETEAMIAGLPAEFTSRKRSFWRLGVNFVDKVDHARGHLRQIRTAIQAARAARLRQNQVEENAPMTSDVSG